MGFWASKALLAAVQFGLFTQLANSKKLSGSDIKNQLQLNTSLRHVLDWLDVLATLGFLQREGVWEETRYFNSPEAEVFLNKNKPSYMGGILQMANHRLYRLHLARLVKVLSNTTGGAGNHPNFCHR